jgi:UDP-N-acetylmuramate dehydrogenase
MITLQQNKPLSDLCTFGIGGPARLFAEAGSIAAMQELLQYCSQQKIPYFILGKGSNCLFDDRGFDGLVILNKIDFIEKEPTGLFYVGAGYSFSLLGTQTARQGWTGLEFASGIPGSVGGAVYMNAGANGGDTSQVIADVEYVAEDGQLVTLSKDQLGFAYRTSCFQKMKSAIVAARFQLSPSQEARQKQLTLISYRTKTQPYGEPSAGCVFRNPQGSHAGALIEKAGLKGVSVGGAKVSELHANFIVNDGNATAHDVLQLMRLIQERVESVSGEELHSEVKVIPYR